VSSTEIEKGFQDMFTFFY